MTARVANSGGLRHSPSRGLGREPQRGAGRSPAKKNLTVFCAVSSKSSSKLCDHLLRADSAIDAVSPVSFLLLLLILLLLRAWQMHAALLLARQIARQPTAGTCTLRRKCTPTFVGVCSARAVRQHHLCAAERRLMVTPPGAQKRRNRPFTCLFDRIRGHRLNKKCSQFREKHGSALPSTSLTCSPGITRDPPFWAILGTITPVRVVPESPPQGDHPAGQARGGPAEKTALGQ